MSAEPYPKRRAPLPRDWADVRDAFIEIAQVLRGAATPEQARARLFARDGAPFHSYHLLDMADRMEDICSRLVELTTERLDDTGAPQ